MLPPSFHILSTDASYDPKNGKCQPDEIDQSFFNLLDGYLKEHLYLPTFIDIDFNLAMMGERWFDSGWDVPNHDAD